MRVGVEMKRKAENTLEDNSMTKHLKMNQNIAELSLASVPLEEGHCDKIRFVNSKNGLEKTSIQKSSVAKKLVIKNFEIPKLPEDYLDITWGSVKDAIIAIQNSKSVDISHEQLYQAVQNLCFHKMAPILYQNLKTLVEIYVKNVKDQFEEQGIDNVTFLKMLERTWNSYCNQMYLIRCIFLHLDRTYVLQNPQIASIWDMSLETFREHMINQDLVKLRLVESLLDLILKERSGEVIDRILVKNILRMLIDLSIYTDLFETRFLKETQQLYQVESERNIEDMEICSYLRHVNKRLSEENERLVTYLDHSTNKKLIPIVEKELIHSHLDKMLKMNFDELIASNKLEYLKLAYDLFGRVSDGHTKLCHHFNQFIKSNGKTIISMTGEKDKSMVQDLLDFKDKLDNIVKTCFSNDVKFVNSLKEAFECFINQRTNKPAELIAKFVDSKLRSGNKETSEEEFEKLLDKVMVLFRFIHGKDIFEAFYKKDLAKRLLLGKSASVDAERSMLLKLKQECGSGFTSKLEGMFKDMELSRELTPNFKSYLVNFKPKEAIEMSVFILTSGYWPPYPPLEVLVPKEFVEYEELFTKFYTSKHMGRKLQWQRNLGHCVLKSNFPKGVKELQVSFFQAMVLLLFNESDELSFKEIHSKTSIEENELKRTLQSLACGKARVISKTPKGRDVDDTDTFMYNLEFTNKLYRIKINQIQLKETQQENESTQERVFQDRQYQIDAAVVRIMKTRKTLQHNLLISEIYNQIKFSATPTEMKKRIESLIERDYLSRDKDNSNLYHYVA